MRLSVAKKIIGIVLAGLLANAMFIGSYSEHEVEDALLDQAKKQAVVFLMGIEREIQHLPDPMNRNAITTLLLNALQHHQHERLDFSPHLIFVFNPEGKILAHSLPNTEMNEHLDGYQNGVLERGEIYISEDVELENNPEGGEPIPLVDIIIPLRINDRIVGGIEAEINMRETVLLMKQRDNAYEQDMVWFLVGSSSLIFLVLWFALHRMILRHVNHFERVTRAISIGDLSQRVRGKLPNDELGHLGQSVNSMAENIARLLLEQEEAYMQTMRSLAKALEAKDAYTAGHSGRVSHISARLGQYLGLSEERLHLLRRGALMHDLGKIGIPDAILNKPTALTETEFAVMRSHPVFTAAIMRPLSRFKEFSEIATWHHERWDGTGYPDGLQGEAIPQLARIVSIADTWDAMTGDRVYRKGMAKERALAILENEQDSGQWDPALIRAFIQMIREQGDE